MRLADGENGEDPKGQGKGDAGVLKSSATQQDLSEQLILWNLDRLVKVARKYNHEETDIYEELARQASRYQGKLDIASLCLTVLGGQATDVVAKAIGKCLREIPYGSMGAYKPFGRGFQRKQRGTCWFCESVDHLVKDCPRMKAAKAK
ncbi:uncharacterized protein [Argopecten irradians]|uniref:uncharacterized protein n=1 Tax=Argopecten irradians TaxID=31199 RepID=UPI00371B275D